MEGLCMSCQCCLGLGRVGCRATVTGAQAPPSDRDLLTRWAQRLWFSLSCLVTGLELPWDSPVSFTGTGDHQPVSMSPKCQ